MIVPEKDIVQDVPSNSKRMTVAIHVTSDIYGSVVVFQRNHGDDEKLLTAGIMDFGGEMAYLKPYERRSLPTRCFKCQQYGHLEARCTAIMLTCRNCAASGHSLKERTSQDVRCAACQGPHKATDRGCPKYLELLREFNPVERPRSSSSKSYKRTWAKAG